MTPAEQERAIAMVQALDRLIAVELAAVRREMHHSQESVAKAVEVAQVEAKERLLSHNGLIEQMRAQQAFYATRETVDLNREGYLHRFEGIDRFQSRVTGALVLIAVAMPVLTILVDHLITG